MTTLTTVAYWGAYALLGLLMVTLAAIMVSMIVQVIRWLLR